jgi:hypothetical protein
LGASTDRAPGRGKDPGLLDEVFELPTAGAIWPVPGS